MKGISSVTIPSKWELDPENKEILNVTSRKIYEMLLDRYSHLFPDILQISLNLNFKELTWYCLVHGSLAKEPLEWQSEKCSTDVNNLIQMLVELRKIVKFSEEDLGEVTISDYSNFTQEKLLQLNCISQFIPISLVIQKGFRLEKDRETLKQLNNLKEFSSWDTLLTSKERVQDYLDYFSPTKISLIDLKNVRDTTEQEIKELCRDCTILLLPTNKQERQASHESK